jgi:hypothetical protein
MSSGKWKEVNGTYTPYKTLTQLRVTLMLVIEIVLSERLCSTFLYWTRSTGALASSTFLPQFLSFPPPPLTFSQPARLTFALYPAPLPVESTVAIIH